MLIYGEQLVNKPIISLKTDTKIASTIQPIINPDNLKIQAYKIASDLYGDTYQLLDTGNIYKIDSAVLTIKDHLSLSSSHDNDKINRLIKTGFQLLGAKVVTSRKHVVGRVDNYTVDTDTFIIQQLSVKPSITKRLSQTRRLVHRSQIKEITRSTIVIDSTDIKLTSLETSGDVHKSYSNPFRKPSSPQPSPLHVITD